MKKKGIIICSILLMLGLTACAGSKEDSVAKKEQEKVSEAIGKTGREKVVESAKEGDLQTEEFEIAIETVPYEKSMYLNDDILLFELKWDRPVLSGSGAEGLAAINEAFEKEMEETIAVLTQDEVDEESYMSFYALAKEQYAEREAMAAEMGEELFFNPFSYQMSYHMQRADDKVITFTSAECSYMGGAHGGNLVTGINYDAQTGKLLTLDDVCTDKEGFLQVSREEIVRQIEEMRGHDPYLFFEEYEKYVSDVFQEGCWYLKESGVSWISREYTLQPYAAGTIEFTIPYKMLEGCMDSAYFTPEEVQEVSAAKEAATKILTDVVDWAGLKFLYGEKVEQEELSPESVAGMMGKVISYTGSANSRIDEENYNMIIPMEDLIEKSTLYFEKDLLTGAVLDIHKLEALGIEMTDEGHLAVGYGDWGLSTPRFRITDAEKTGEDSYRIAVEYYMYDYETSTDSEVRATADYEIVKDSRGRYGYLIRDMKMTVK